MSDGPDFRGFHHPQAVPGPDPARPREEADSHADPALAVERPDESREPSAGSAPPGLGVASPDPSPAPAVGSSAPSDLDRSPEQGVEALGPSEPGPSPEREDGSPGPSEASVPPPGREVDSSGSVPPPAERAPAPPPSRSPSKPGRSLVLHLVDIEKIEDDRVFQLRPEGEIDPLATSLARLGQLFPVDLRPLSSDRLQVVCGFRRVAALRLLKRERVLARIHDGLSDEDALRLGLADLLEQRGCAKEELVEVRARLREERRLFPSVAEALDRAISPPDDALGPEDEEDEVDLDELAREVIGRLAAVNQDLAVVAELFSALEPDLRQSLLDQLGYSGQLAAWLRGG